MAVCNIGIECKECESSSYKDSALSGCKLCVAGGIVALAFITASVLIWTLFFT
jgi:hypothetical protein